MKRLVLPAFGLSLAVAAGCAQLGVGITAELHEPAFGVDPDEGEQGLEQGANAGGNRGLRAAYRMSAYRDASGNIPHDAILRAQAALSVLPESVGTAGGLDSANWTNPGPGFGRIRAFAAHPADRNLLFVGSVSGGIWRSTDRGMNWQPVDDRMGNLAITSIVVDPAAPDVLYASTGEGYASNISSGFNTGARGAGIFKSVDRGVSWSRLPATATADFYYTNRLAIASNGRSLLAATDTGLWQSTDGGASFLLRAGGSTERSREVEFHPSRSDVAVAYLNSFANGTRAVYSVDGGNTWQNATGLADPIRRRIEFDFHPGWTGAGNGCVYAQMEITGGIALYRSVDGGASFVEVQRNYMYAAQMFYNNTLFVAPTPRDANPANDVILCGTTTLARSTDGGASFDTNIYSGQAHVDFHLLQEVDGFDGGASRGAWLCSDGGFFRVDDVLGSPLPITNLNDGLKIHQHYAGSRDAASGQMITGAQDNGVWYRQDGQSWSFVMFGDGGYSAIDPVDPAYAYGSTQFGAIVRFHNGGSPQWISGTQRSNPRTVEKLPGYIITDARDRRSQFIAPVVMDPNQPQRLLVGMERLWRTNDARTPNDEVARTGPAWAVIKPAHSSGLPISAVTIDPQNPDVVFVGHTFVSGIARTTNGTAANPTWTEVGAGVLPARHVSRILVDPQDSNRVFVVYGGFTPDNVWRSLDAGQTWTSLASFPAVPVRDLKIHPTRPTWLYAATELGLLVSEDDGVTWTDSASPSDVSIFELEWSNDELYCFTHGRGTFHQRAVDAVPGPDLEVVALSTPAGGTSWDGGTRYPLTLTLRNAGNVASPGGALAIVMSSDQLATVGDELLETAAMPGLAPGQTTTLNLQFGTPACWSTSGTGHVGVILDAANRIQETDENDNAAVLPAARNLVAYNGPIRRIEYLDPRFENSAGAAWRGFAQWSAGQGVTARLCASAPQNGGLAVIPFMSFSATPAPDDLASISLSLPVFSPVIGLTQFDGSPAVFTQTFPAISLPSNIQVYVHTAWFTPNYQFLGFGSMGATNLVLR